MAINKTYALGSSTGNVAIVPQAACQRPGGNPGAVYAVDLNLSASNGVTAALQAASPSAVGNVVIPTGVGRGIVIDNLPDLADVRTGHALAAADQ